MLSSSTPKIGSFLNGCLKTIVENKTPSIKVKLGVAVGMEAMGGNSLRAMCLYAKCTNHMVIQYCMQLIKKRKKEGSLQKKKRKNQARRQYCWRDTKTDNFGKPHSYIG